MKQAERIHDIDLQVDALMSDEASRVDWHALDESEASSFGLAVALYRDAAHAQQNRRVAWMTAIGGVISMCVLTLVCVGAKMSPRFALTVIIVTQCIRALWLYSRVYRARHEEALLEQQAFDVINELAEAHPVKADVL